MKMMMSFEKVDYAIHAMLYICDAILKYAVQ